MTERELFIAARSQCDPAERAALLERTCGDDPALRARVEELLCEEERLGNFLETPAEGLCAAGVLTSAPAETAAVRERPGAAIGPYQLLEQIGEGGMGTVYLAQQTVPVKRLVALKVIRSGMDSRSIIARFEAERQALALMDHPNIARVLDAGTTGNKDEGGRPYFVMELVQGTPITRYCDEQRLTPRARLELLIPVCQAIQHAHQKGIIHRDIKPSNVLVTLYDAMPVPKVIDFGVAKASGPQPVEPTALTRVGAVVGTLEYMSPEQAEMNPLDVDTRSDIYSLGVLLYELLTGTTPLESARLKQVMMLDALRLIREEEPPTPSTRLAATEERASVAAKRGLEPGKLCGVVRGELDWVVMKCLDKDRNRRYETANGLARDLERYLRDEPVQACPPSAWYRFRKFARRNRRALAMAALLGVTVLAALTAIAGSIGWSMRDQAERAALTEREVYRALEDAAALQKHGKWPEAVEAARRAEALLAVGGSDEIRAQASEVRKDLDMVMRLESIRLPRAGGAEGPFDADGAYASAFREYGIDVDALGTAVAAERIAARPIRQELVVALDDWVNLRRRGARTDAARRQHLLAVARAADPDDWRNRVRDAVEHRRIEELVKLAESPQVGSLPVQSLSLLGGALHNLGAAEGTLVLQQAQQQYPDDFWINFQLAWALDHAPPQRTSEASRYYTAALALRPRNVGVHRFLADTLRREGKLDAAIATLRRVLESQPAESDNLIDRRQLRQCYCLVADNATGKHREIARIAEEFPRLFPEEQDDWFRAAWYLSSCVAHVAKDSDLPANEQTVLARRYADRAMDMLRQSVAKGNRNAERLRIDPALVPLRSRQDFQELLAGMQGGNP